MRKTHKLDGLMQWGIPPRKAKNTAKPEAGILRFLVTDGGVCAILTKKEISRARDIRLRQYGKKGREYEFTEYAFKHDGL